MSRAPGRRPRIGTRGALAVIGLLFAASALVRLAEVAGPAIAREMGQLRPEAGAETAQQCEPPPDIAAVLQALSEREAEISAREEALATAERAVALARDEVQAQLAALEEAEKRLSATIAKSAEAAEDDLTRLTTVYENMKPKDAAALFETMTPEFAAGFIGRMRPDAAAAIMAGLKPDVAYAISVILAGRNADAPTN